VGAFSLTLAPSALGSLTSGGKASLSTLGESALTLDEAQRIAVKVAILSERILGFSIMPEPGRFIACSKQEQGTLQQQLRLLESGKVRTGEDRETAGSIRQTNPSAVLERGSPN